MDEKLLATTTPSPWQARNHAFGVAGSQPRLWRGRPATTPLAWQARNS